MRPKCIQSFPKFSELYPKCIPNNSYIPVECILPALYHTLGGGWGREGALSKGSLSSRSLSYNNAFQYDAYLTYSNTVKIPNASQMHQKCIRNLSQIQPSLPRSQSLKYYKNQNKHTYFFLYYLYLSHIYPKFNLLSLYLTYSNTVKIPNLSQMHQKCIRNLSQIQPSLPRSQSLKYCKNQNKHTYFLPILPIFIPLKFIPIFNPTSHPISHLLKYCKNPKCIPNASECIRNLSQIQPSLPRSQSLKYCKNQNKHTYFFLYYLYLSQIYPKFNFLSLYLTYSNTVKIPNLSQIYWLIKGPQIGPNPPQYLGISPTKLKIIFPVYISSWKGLESDWSVPTGEG